MTRIAVSRGFEATYCSLVGSLMRQFGKLTRERISNILATGPSYVRFVGTYPCPPWRDDVVFSVMD